MPVLAVQDVRPHNPFLLPTSNYTVPDSQLLHHKRCSSSRLNRKVQFTMNGLDLLKQEILSVHVNMQQLKLGGEEKQAEFDAAQAHFVELRSGLGVLKTAIKFDSDKDGVETLVFRDASRAGKSKYEFLCNPDRLVDALDGDAAAPLSSLRLMISTRGLKSTSCLCILPTDGPTGQDAMGCCWNPKEESEPFCKECTLTEDPSGLARGFIYLVHVEKLCNYTFKIESDVEAQVISHILEAGSVDTLPIPPRVYPDTALSTSERSQEEVTRKATPIKKAAQAASHKVETWNSQTGGSSGGLRLGASGADEFDPAILDDLALNTEKHLLSPSDLQDWLQAVSPAHGRELREIQELMKVARAQILALQKQLKHPSLTPHSTKSVMASMNSMLMNQTSLVSRQMALTLKSHQSLVSPLKGVKAVPAAPPQLQVSVGGPSKEELQAQLQSLLDQQKRLEHTLKDPNIFENEMMSENFGIQLREVEFEVAQAQARLHNFELAPSKLAPPSLSAFSPSSLIANAIPFLPTRYGILLLP